MARDDFGGSPNFETTQWSEVFRAQATQSSVRRQAIGELARRYYPALYAHLVRGRRYDHHRASDYLQGFLTDKLLEHRLADHADPSRGKFRSLLIRALHNYIIDVERPKKPHTVDTDVEPEPTATDVDPFEVAWARNLLDEALSRMKGECAEKAQSSIWEVFECRLLIPTREGAAPASYDELVQRFHFKSPEQASNALVTAKRTFNRVFAEVATDYMADGDDPEDLLRDLLTTLRRVGPLDWQQNSGIRPPTAAKSRVYNDALDDSSPRLVAALIENAPHADSVWEPQELAELIRHQLSQPCASLLHVPSTELVDGDASAGETFSLLDLFTHPRPSLSALEAAKRYGRRQARNDSEMLLREVATVTYFASIAAALVRCDQRISSSGDEVLHFGLQRLREYDWLPPDLVRLFDAALQKVGNS